MSEASKGMVRAWVGGCSVNENFSRHFAQRPTHQQSSSPPQLFHLRKFLQKSKARGCVFYFASVSVLFLQIFLRVPICTKTDSECTAHRDLFHVSQNIVVFQEKKSAATIFNYLNKIDKTKRNIFPIAPWFPVPINNLHKDPQFSTKVKGSFYLILCQNKLQIY